MLDPFAKQIEQAVKEGLNVLVAIPFVGVSGDKGCSLMTAGSTCRPFAMVLYARPGPEGRLTGLTASSYSRVEDPDISSASFSFAPDYGRHQIRL